MVWFQHILYSVQIIQNIYWMSIENVNLSSMYDIWTVWLIYNFISNRCLYLTFVQTDLGVRGARWSSRILWTVHHRRLHHAILHCVQVSSPVHLSGKPHPTRKVGQVPRQVPLQDRDRPSRREGSIFQDGHQGISC